MAIKRDALDALVSDLVRERNGWICESCHRDMGHDRVNCHAAHIHGRRILRLRHDPRNILCLCSRCHAYFGDRPLAFAAEVRHLLGAGVADELRVLANEIHKRPTGWKKEARVHYREEAKRMKARRMAGDTGYLEFAGYW